MKTVAILGTPDNDRVTETFERVERWLASRARIVFAEITLDSRQVTPHEPDLVFVLGGDGSLISAIHGLGMRQRPIVGINLGKLGYLAEFTADELEEEGGFLFNGSVPITPRVLMRVQLTRNGDEAFDTLAVNDAVFLAGAPFRMIELLVQADGDNVARIRGDGLIVATASGSTAHNLSAGGPILDPRTASFALTPIAPHALTFRPLALDSDRRIDVRTMVANEGTTLNVDGRFARTLHAGARVTITRYPANLQLVRNPARSVWYALRRKLMWGKSFKSNPR